MLAKVGAVDLALDADGDLALDSTGNLYFLTEGDAVVQRLRIRWQLFLGEWFLDQRLGMPWFEHVFVKRPNLTLVRSLCRQLVLQTPGVDGLVSLELGFVPGTRQLTATFEVLTTEGELVTFTPGPLLEAT